MTGSVVAVLVAVGVVLVVLLLVAAVRRRRAPVLGDVSRTGAAGSGWSATRSGAGSMPAATSATDGSTQAPALPDAGAVPGVDELLARDDQIGAVKAYRDATGAGLRESSQAVRRWIVANRGAANLDEVRMLLTEGQAIQAIKVYRQQTGVGLAEAKRAVERIAAGPAQPADGPADFAEVRRLVQAGRKIQAIKLYRQQTGTGLAAAKQAVERIADGATPAEPAAVPAELIPVQQLVRSGRKIEAIKHYRQLTGASLAEAKTAVESRPW